MKCQELNLSSTPQELAMHLAEQPGVYMFRHGNEILYIGKARNLRKRVSSYLQLSHLDIKSRRLMEKADNVQITLTRNNTEALLLEQNLIKEHRPPYNIALRDNKSYPYIFISAHKNYPLMTFHRGAQKRSGQYYGPFPSAGAVHQSIDILQKIFKVRSCSDSFFANRSRPCLQYQIGRCSAPCVQQINEEEYHQNINYIQLFLKGRSSDVIKNLTSQMLSHSKKMEYEEAANKRNKITALRHLQEQQYATRNQGNLDAVAISSHGNLACVYILFIRQGKILGSRHYFFRSPAFDNEEKLLADFMNQYYLQSQMQKPKEIITPYPWKGMELFITTLKRQTGHSLRILSKVRSDKKKWLDMAKTNSQAILTTALDAHSEERFNQLSQLLHIPLKIDRIECFDISHSSGHATQAACVVFTSGGKKREDYRRYNITGITKGDDYAAMKQAIMRRYKDQTSLPQLLLIDGGRGQLNAALDALENLQIRDIYLIGIAKDKKRKYGRETFYLSSKLVDGSEELQMIEYSSHHSPVVLNILLKIRDETHRFVLHGHKRKRTKLLLTSSLTTIQGLGPERQKALLKHFGGIEQLKNAGIDDICQVPGFGKGLASAIFNQIRK